MISLRCRDVVVLKVISAYRPQANARPYTVHQHLQKYTIKKIRRDPIRIFYDELSSILRNWIENGNNVLLLIDANELLTRKVGVFSPHDGDDWITRADPCSTPKFETASH